MSYLPLKELASPHVLGLHAYTPGLQPNGPGWVKLNTNECPYPPSPRVAEALLKEIGPDGASLRLYPNPKANPLRTQIARLHRLRYDQVCVGNGSDDLLNLLVRVFCGPTSDVATRLALAATDGPDAAAAAGWMFPSYSLYPVLVAIQDGHGEVIEFDRSMQLPWERIAKSTARAFFLTSPNAPTGVAFSNADIERVLTSFPGLLIVDEAYVPFAKENTLSILDKYPRLVIVRTLSKAYALAGIRVGYVLADPDIIGLLDRVRDSYNVSRLAQTAAIAALEDQEYHLSLVAKIVATREKQLACFAQRGWFTYPSQANFLFTEPKNARGETGPAVAKAAYDFLYARKVLVRHFPHHAFTAPFLRVSVGTDSEMQVLQDTLDAWLRQ